MEEVFVFNSYRAKPGDEEVIATALRDMAVKIRAEPACRFLHVFRSVNYPSHFVVYSCWRDRKSLDAFVALPHVIQYLDEMQSVTDHQLDAAFMHQID